MTDKIKKSYNPLKMRGGWIGTIIILSIITFFMINGIINCPLVDREITERNKINTYRGYEDYCIESCNWVIVNPSTGFRQLDVDSCVKTCYPSEGEFYEVIGEDLNDYLLGKNNYDNTYFRGQTMSVQGSNCYSITTSKLAKKAHTSNVSLSSWLIYRIIFIISGFLIGWGIHSLIRKYKK